MKGTVQKVETLKEGEIKLSVSTPRENKHKAMDLLYEDVNITGLDKEVSVLADLPRIAGILQSVVDMINGISDEGDSEGQEISESRPESNEVGQTGADMTSDKGEGDESGLESKIESRIVGDYEGCEDCIKDTNMKISNGYECLTPCNSPKKAPKPADPRQGDCPGTYNALNIDCQECINDCESRKGG
jgi:hypothetical protein